MLTTQLHYVFFPLPKAILKFNHQHIPWAASSIPIQPQISSRHFPACAFLYADLWTLHTFWGQFCKWCIHGNCVVIHSYCFVSNSPLVWYDLQTKKLVLYCSINTSHAHFCLHLPLVNSCHIRNHGNDRLLLCSSFIKINESAWTTWRYTGWSF